MLNKDHIFQCYFTLIQIMACHLLGATSLPGTMVTYCQIDWTLLKRLQEI